MKISGAVVVGLVITHPQTWQIELRKIEYSILKEAIRTEFGNYLRLIEALKKLDPTDPEVKTKIFKCLIRQIEITEVGFKINGPLNGWVRFN